MDEEVDEPLALRYSEITSKDGRKRSSVMSLERSNLDFYREASLGNKKSFMDIMNLEGSERNEDIHELNNFEERRRSLMRSSNNAENAMEEEMEELHRRSLNQKRTFHECSCQGSCNEYHCPCFNEPLELCLLGECCPNCITFKSKRMKEDLEKIKIGPENITRGSKKNPKRRENEEGAENKRKKQKTDSTQIGCFCKKSNCLKKYCKCFSEGKQCGELCCCEDCRNKFDEGDDVEEMRLERQRYGRVDSQNDDIDCYFAGNDFQNLQMPGSMEFEHPNLRQAYDRN